MRFLVLALFFSITCGCNIPIYRVTPTSYTNSWVERELDELLPVDASHVEARSILKKNGYDDVLLVSREIDEALQNELVVSKRLQENESIRVTMPVKDGRITKPFRIDWVDTISGSITMSETFEI